MIRWLLRQWHRFTLGRTARQLLRIGYPHPGSIGYLVLAIEEGAQRTVPAGVVYEVVYRRDSSLLPAQVRIVIESREP